MKRVLVTGGAGFVGHHLVCRLLEIGCIVHVLDDLSTGYKENVPKETVFFEGDIRDGTTVRKSMEQCDTVFHLAARVELQKSILNPSDCFSVNVTGTANIIEECLKKEGRRLVFASSCSVYPLHPAKPLAEDMATLGETPYALSKRMGEQAIEIFNALKELNACSLRCFNIYGPRQRVNSPYAAVIPKFIDLAIKGLPLTIYGEGNQTRDFISVEDVVDCYIRAAQSTVKGVYNLGTARATCIKELAEKIVMIERLSEIRYLPPVAGDASASLSDMELTHRIFGFLPKVNLIEGLESLYWSMKNCDCEDFSYLGEKGGLL